MPTKGGRAVTDIHGDIKDGAPCHTHELALGMGRTLEMEAAQHTSGARQRMIVLYEGTTYAGSAQHLMVVSFRKEAALITKNRRREELHLSQSKRFNLHRPSLGAPVLPECLAGGNASR